MRSMLTVIALSGMLACATKATPVYVAPSNDTIQSGTEMTFGGEGQYIYIVNLSSVPITITGLHLTSCENVKNRCETTRLRVTIRPGARENLVIVRPDNPTRGFSFRFTYSWEPARER